MNDIYLMMISAMTFILFMLLIHIIYQLATKRRKKILGRLQGFQLSQTLAEEALDKPFLTRTVGPLADYLKGLSDKLTPHSLQRAIERSLVQAGKKTSANEFITFMGIMVVFFTLLAWVILGLFIEGKFVLLIFSGLFAGIGGLLPWLGLKIIIGQRQNEVRKNLPNVMDLVVVSVEAGLSFDLAILRVTDKFKGVVSEEFSSALGQMRMGMTRKQALQNLGQRLDVPELTTMLNAIIQSDQIGSSLGGVLRLQADLIRNQRQQQIEEKAMKAPIKMLFPLVGFIFPAMFVVLLGPALINILRVFDAMGK